MCVESCLLVCMIMVHHDKIETVPEEDPVENNPVKDTSEDEGKSH
jgi:hypothetical protein